MNTTQDTHSQARNVSSTKNEPFTTEELVSVSGLAKAFGSHRVLHDINLDAHRGEMVALLGATEAENRPRCASWRDWRPPIRERSLFPGSLERP